MEQWALLAIVVAVLIAAMLANRNRRTTESLELKLSVVGFESSGKTVFIGSMFHQLRVPDADGIFLGASPENTGKLLALYSTTADTDKQFPKSTSQGELIEWPFTVKVKSRAGVTDVARFSYLDFAGESMRELYNAPNPEAHRLFARFKDADVLMGALDGVQVKRYMEGRPRPRFHGDLNTLLALLSDHEKAVNLILTKWDILEDHYSFRQVVERLFQITQFEHFVKSQEIIGGCRLIPVSSVGHGFVREVGDSMRKIPGKVISPVRVELPIASMLPGALHAAKQRNPDRRARSLLAWANAVKVTVGPVAIGVNAILPEPALWSMTAGPSSPLAVSQLIGYCKGRLDGLDRDFPENDLVKFMHRQGM
jgi:hypothetical protein